MIAVISQRRIALAILAIVTGSAVCWVTGTLFGLLAPVAALFLFARGNAVRLLNLTLSIAVAAALLAVLMRADGPRDLALPGAAVLALALCIGAVVAAVGANPIGAEAAQAVRIIASMPAHTWSASADGRVTHVSASTLAYTGQAVDRPGLFHILDNAGWRRMVHPDDYGRVIDTRRHSLKTGTPFDTVYRLRRADGTYRWVRSFGSAPRDDHDRVVGWFGTMIDIEEQKRAEAALRDRERELSQLVDMVPSHLWRLSPGGEPVFFSKRMVDFLGLDVADLDKPGIDRLDALVAVAVHPEDAAELARKLRGCLVTGAGFTMMYRLRRADGIYRWMSSRAEPMRDLGGDIVQWYGLCHDIDDQMHAEKALRRSERQLQQLADAVPALIWAVTPDGKPSYVNKQFTDVTGATLEDITGPDGSPSLSVVHPDDRDAAIQAVGRSFAAGLPYVMQYRQRRRDGSYRWTETRAEAFRDDCGEILQWYGVSVDIDDLVTTQAALQDRERELSQLVDLVPSYLWRLTPEGEPNFFNKRLIDFLGPQSGWDDKPGRSRLTALIEAAVHPADAAGLAEALARCFATGERFHMKYRLRRTDGVYRWVEGRAEPLRDQTGRIVQWYGLSSDIDDQLRTEEALRQSERSFRQLVETLPALIYCATPNGEPTYRSRQLSDFLGFGLDDMDEPGNSRLTGTLDAIIHPDDLAAVRDHYGRSLATGEPYARKHRLRRFDGSYRWVETRARPMRDAQGAIVQWNGVCFDIEDQIRAQEDLRQAQESLSRASQAASLAELSASIAHEVNQPLAAVVANSHACQRWLMAEPPNIDRAQKTVARIIRDANSAADVVSRIRALFRQSEESRTCMMLGGIVAEARDLLAEEAARRSVRVDVEVEGGLPPVALDPVQVQQVLVNLIRNAMEAMEEVAHEKLLRIRVRRAGDLVQTEVSDRGPGIACQGRVFEPFFTTKRQGMGMGLAICRSIVESHGGRLWAEGNDPQGAIFIFTLPSGAQAAP